MTCQYVDCCRDGTVERRTIRGETVLKYCDTHDPLDPETDADPDLWREA